MKTATWVKGGMLALALVLGCFFGYRQLLPSKAQVSLKEETITLSQAQEGPDLQLMLSHIKAMAS